MTELSFFVVVVKNKFDGNLFSVTQRHKSNGWSSYGPLRALLFPSTAVLTPSLLSRIQPHIYQLAFSAAKASGFRVCDIKASEQRPNHVNIHNQTLHSFD